MKREVPYRDGKKVLGTVVPFDVIRENWNEYKLQDGTTLRSRNVAIEILRLDGEKTDTGEQVYMVKANNIIATVDNLEGLLEGR